MTDAQDAAPKKGWFQRLTVGLSKSSRHISDQVVGVFVKRPLDQEALDDLEEMLIQADLGIDAAGRIVEAFSQERFGKEASESEIKESLAHAVAAELSPHQARFDPLGGPKPYVVLMVGVNGSGKTTTLGKLAAELKRQGARVLLAAGDTFRAAAVEQLKIWAERADAPVVLGPQGADAAGLAFDAVEQARPKAFDVLLIDTAGRLQNTSGLMDELAKVLRVLRKLDATLPARGAAGARRHRGPATP